MRLNDARNYEQTGNYRQWVLRDSFILFILDLLESKRHFRLYIVVGYHFSADSYSFVISGGNRRSNIFTYNFKFSLYFNLNLVFIVQVEIQKITKSLLQWYYVNVSVIIYLSITSTQFQYIHSSFGYASIAKKRSKNSKK